MTMQRSKPDDAPAACRFTPRRAVPGFELVRELGNGGMAIVYEARRGGEAIALKVLMSTSDEQLRLRFRLEGELLVSLRHPGLVRGLHYEVGRSHAWIAMEYLEGRQLADAILEPEFALGDRLELWLDVARTVEFLHDHGVVHRDIKPSNIVLLEGGGARLIDLGIAKMGALELTPHGTLTASPYSIAPEEILEMEVDHRADIFSLGILLHHLLTGAHPWPKKNLYATMYTRCITPAPSICEVGAGPLGEPPARFAPLVLRALERDPNDRYMSLRELIAAVEAVL